MTIISKSKNFIFIHIRKCGGTSIEQSYQKYARWNDLVIGSSKEGEILQPIYERLHGLHKHNTASEIKNIIGEEHFNKYWRFALVRHPQKLIESFYKWSRTLVIQKSQNDEEIQNRWRKNLSKGEADFDFLNWGPIKSFLLTTSFSEFVNKAVSENLIQGSQTSFLLSDKNEPIVNNWYKLENIDVFWEAFGNKTETRIEPLHRNKSIPITLKWDDKMRDIVFNRYSSDYKFFSYQLY